MYYFSYGMNTNPYQMSWRCPTAVDLGRASLPDFRFEFKRHATIDDASGGIVDGVLWKITETDEESLDILEGYPNYYTKKMVTVWSFEECRQVEAMTYMMFNHEKLMQPDCSYFDMVKEGYMEHDIPIRQLIYAINRVKETNNDYSFDTSIY